MRENNFDFLRFILALIVVIGHLIIVSGIDEFQQCLKYLSSYTSVTAFFIISGFLITSSYLRTNSTKKYFKKRAQRLLPAYFFVIFACVTLLSLVSKLPFEEYFSNSQLYKYLIANITFFNFIEPCLPGVFNNDMMTCDVNGALWTIKIEVGFYIIIPLLINLINKVKTKYILFIIIYVLAVIYKLSFEHLTIQSGNFFYAVIGRQLPGFMSYFICGISCYYYYNIFIRNKFKLLIIGVILFSIERSVGLEILTPLALSLIVFSVAFSVKQLNKFAKFGDISYGIYIFHMPIFKTAVEMKIFQEKNPYLIAVLLIAIVICVGYASWHLLEKQFLNKSRVKIYESTPL